MTFGMPRALFAVLSLTVYHAGAEGTGLLYAAVSAGATVAALTTGWLGHARRLGRIVIVAVVVWGLAIAAAGLVTSLWPALVALAVAGAADSVSAVCRSTINQTVTTDALRGRMSSVFSLVVTSGPRLGDVESGTAAGAIGARASVVSGGLACVVGVGLLMMAMPSLYAYDSEDALAEMAAAAGWASADRSSAAAFERMTAAACSRGSPAMSVSHTNASMPSVAPMPSTSRLSSCSGSFPRSGARASSIQPMRMPRFIGTSGRSAGDPSDSRSTVRCSASYLRMRSVWFAAASSSRATGSAGGSGPSSDSWSMCG